MTHRIAILVAALLASVPASTRAAWAVAPYVGATTIADGDPECTGRATRGIPGGIDLGGAGERFDFLMRIGTLGNRGGRCGGKLTASEWLAVINIALSERSRLGLWGIGLGGGFLDVSKAMVPSKFLSGSGATFGYSVDLWWKYPLAEFGEVRHQGDTYPRQLVALMPRVGWRGGDVEVTYDTYTHPKQTFSVSGPYVCITLFVAFNLGRGE